MAEYLTLDRVYDLTQSVPALSSATLTTGFDRQRPVLTAADYTGKTAFEIMLALDSGNAPGEIVFHSGALGAVLTHTPAFNMGHAWGTWLWCRCRYKTSNWTPWSVWRKFQLGWRPNVTDLASLVLRLEPDLLSAGAVTTWADLSGGSHDATQGTAANKPTASTNQLNGYPTVQFDGTNDRLATDLRRRGGRRGHVRLGPAVRRDPRVQRGAVWREPPEGRRLPGRQVRSPVRAGGWAHLQERGAVNPRLKDSRGEG